MKKLQGILLVLLLPFMLQAQAANDRALIAQINSATQGVSIISAGEYIITQPIKVVASRSFTLIAHAGANFIVSEDFPSGRAVFEFNSANHEDVDFSWTGGKFSAQDMPVRTTGAPDVFKVQGYRLGKVTIRDLTIALSPLRDRGDSGIFVGAAKSVYIDNIEVCGAMDAGLYISGSSSGEPRGDFATVTNSRFCNNNVDLISKRLFERLHVTNNHFTDSTKGVGAGGEADKKYLAGNFAIISGNTFKNVTQPIEFRYIDYGRAFGNIIYGVGTSDKWGSAFMIRGARFVDVHDNTIVVRSTDRPNSVVTHFLDTGLNEDDYRYKVASDNKVYSNRVVGNIMGQRSWSKGVNNIYTE